MATFAIYKIDKGNTGLLWGRGAFVTNTPAIVEEAEPSVPVITQVSPLGGVLTQTQPVVVDVTDPELRRALLWVSFAALGVDELVFDGSAFTSRYAASSRSSIANGYRFTISRRGGWPGSPQLNVRAYDDEGQEA